jgi:hypothetical protein
MAPTPTIPVRIPRELADRIDRLRGLAPREAWVRDRLEKLVAAEERKQAKR